METRLFLLRHARSAPRPELPARAYPLAPEGEAQATALVPTLALAHADPSAGFEDWRALLPDLRVLNVATPGRWSWDRSLTLESLAPGLGREA